jgi:hypothetical protein
MEVIAEELRQLRALAIRYQHAIEKLVGAN